ncbi:hypothetical protein [Pseudoalteromonas rhizosphaerae]|uniref:Uncharacterized protein n=1 Tax=Pseudoalteromonas rhizosphaerae TaxID=2518973 RepID=A0ABW8KZI8_9GAMM
MFNLGAMGGAANTATATAVNNMTAMPQQSAWGNFTGGVNNALGNAMNLYGQFEQIQAMKKSAGVTQVEKQNTTEYDNGAAVLVDNPKTPAIPNSKTNEVMVFGFPQKTVLMAFGGLLVVGVLLKVAKS